MTEETKIKKLNKNGHKVKLCPSGMLTVGGMVFQTISQAYKHYFK